MNLCPSCKSDDPARAGSRYQCMDCGRVLGSRRRPKGERPDARQLTIQSIADGKRFRGRAPLGMLSFPIVSLVVLSVVAATIATEAPLSTTVTTVFAVLSALAVMWFVLILAHYSEIDVTPAAIEIRSFPFGGRSAGTYPRQRVVAFGWIRVPGHKGSGSYDVHLALDDGRTVRVPIAVEGEAQCVYVTSKLRAAFKKTAP